MTTDIYLDCNATTPVLPAALAAAQNAMGALFGNPSSSHTTGLQARHIVDSVRACAARVLGSGDGQLVFTSGATEGIQTAVLSALCAVRDRQARGEAVGRLLLYGATEHKAVPQSLAHWNAVLGLQLELRALPVDAEGRHDLAVLRALAPQAALVCTMAANNETGVVSDLAGIEAVLNGVAPQAYWLVDCVQALGKLPLQLAQTRIDYAPFSGHKLYAPKGIGLLYVRSGAPFTPLLAGGGQEAGRRAGTENMVGIAALGAVLQALEDGGSFCSPSQMLQFRERLAQSLQAAWPDIVFNAPFATALPTTLNFSVPGVASSVIVDLLDAAGVRVSAGSACSAQLAAPSYVLQAMGVPDWQAASAVRLSFGALADDAFIDAACARIARCGAAWRAEVAPPLPDALPPRHGPALADDPAMHLQPEGLNNFLRNHPEAVLVDVREAYEHRADPQPLRFGRAVRNAPLGRLGPELADCLGDPVVPLVFFCRSGRRSLRAVQTLRQLGYAQVWQVVGGLATNSIAASAD
ncbi:cysteine sulfinate desulfinase/cysteine desulfurase-like protein/rhodanese-related sulfurtransferase [Rhodoferax ferrireducens]|uniref:cysteine desulfurase n=1 Tax=Rhodoferax ferrireducens TaxID=192843 RepID=A0ABU2CDU9_9BURK|nr:aminotransferase class V-fold PLP-dependent enzyme [Rhodoferax ferrireducens]MDR7379466.1 cysteine sulfinate desulfinase/cysteine desulfurase-like protein/rhodanese-related sulfurtransferase [Rhodoferax ferrireducens]